ncbi:MAG: hypothetical protein HGA31_00710 [Candidatus Moranbacteria bacterium]|nr:hypothetical protein [Candidatus Moranbacteria bacterium]
MDKTKRTAILLKIAASIIGIHGIVLLISFFRDGAYLNSLSSNAFLIFSYLVFNESRRVIPERLRLLGDTFGLAIISFLGIKVILELLALGTIIPHETADAYLTWNQKTDGSMIDFTLQLVGNIIVFLSLILFVLLPLAGWCAGKLNDFIRETPVSKARLPKN